MAFGLTPKFEQTLDINGLNPEHYLVIALDAAKQLDWNIFNITKKGFSAYTGFSMLSWNEEVNVIIGDDNVTLKSRCLGNQLIDWGKNKTNVKDFLNTFENIKSSLTEQELEEKVNEVMPPLREQEQDILTSSPATTAQKFRDAFSIFKPSEGYYITPIIIDINLLVFVLMIISGVSIFEPTTGNLIAWGADLRGLTLDGQWWRLITSMFLHVGIFHILLNMYALLYIGILLEPLLGKLRFATAYLVTGILASLASIYWHPLTVSAGASGAIFGMYGVFLALLSTNIIDKKTRSALFASIAVFVGFNLLNGVKAGIDNAAHIGGLITGLVTGYVYYPSLKKPDATNVKYATIGVLLVMTGIASVIIYRQTPNDMARYAEKMKDYSVKEAIAIAVFDGKNSPGPKMLADIKDKGLGSWNDGLQILDEADKLDIPQELKDRDSIIREYSQLQIKKYKLLYKAVEQNTLDYDKSIDSCNKGIHEILTGLTGKKGD